MDIINVEIKAKIDESHFTAIQDYLEKNSTTNLGIDLQSDYYFNSPKGRLKLRIGNVEQSLIYYQREEVKGLKTSSIKLYKPVKRPQNLLDTLKAAYGLKVEVHKKRKIYFINHVKFHLDTVKGLGKFCEIEAISKENEFTEIELRDHCSQFMHELNIVTDQLIDASYSDLILKH